MKLIYKQNRSNSEGNAVDVDQSEAIWLSAPLLTTYPRKTRGTEKFVSVLENINDVFLWIREGRAI